MTGVQTCALPIYKNQNQDNNNDEKLIAYIVSSSELSQTELRKFLQDKLPAYMIPSSYIMLEEFPLTPNRKVDIKALPLPDDINQANQNSIYIPPRTVTEEIVAGIWAEVLNLPQISIDDNFFELGGHSLLATRVNSQIKQAFAVELPLRSHLKIPLFPNLPDLSKQLAEKQ